MSGKSGTRSINSRMTILGKLGGMAVKFLKFAKIGKIAFAGATTASYALMFTWQFALVIVGMLVVHEYGHLWMMKRFGMRTKGMYLIPFLGAAAVADEAFPSRRAETQIAIAGPLVGAGLAVLGGLGFLLTGNAYFAATASWMAFINLFNLLPVSPLDGGRVLKSVTFSIGTRYGLTMMVCGLLAAAVLAFEQDLLIFAIIIPLGVIDYLVERHNARKRDAEPKPVMSPRGTRYAFLGYVGLAVFLWSFMLLMGHQPGAAAAMQTLQG